MFAREGGGNIVAILRIIASTNFLVQHEKVGKYESLTAGKQLEMPRLTS